MTLTVHTFTTLDGVMPGPLVERLTRQNMPVRVGSRSAGLATR